MAFSDFQELRYSEITIYFSPPHAPLQISFQNQTKKCLDSQISSF